MGFRRIHFRPAVASDSNFLSSQIYLASKRLWRYLFGYQAQHALNKLLLNQEHLFSYHQCWVVESYGQPAGMALGYAWHKQSVLSLKSAGFILAASWSKFIRLIRLAFIFPHGTGRVQTGEFYISSLAVAPSFRKQGVATALLNGLVLKAKDQGCCKLVVDVRISNKRALNFYYKQGFTLARLSAKPFPANSLSFRSKSSDLIRLVKHI